MDKIGMVDGDKLLDWLESKVWSCRDTEEKHGWNDAVWTLNRLVRDGKFKPATPAPTQPSEVCTKFKIVLVCPDRAPDYYAIEYIPNGHRTGSYDNEREANERMDELAWVYAQGQSTARSQERRELEMANRENTNLIIQNTRFLNALYEILDLEEGRVKRSGKDIGHCGVIAKTALAASPEASQEGGTNE